MHHRHTNMHTHTLQCLHLYRSMLLYPSIPVVQLEGCRALKRLIRTLAYGWGCHALGGRAGGGDVSQPQHQPVALPKATGGEVIPLSTAANRWGGGGGGLAHLHTLIKVVREVSAACKP
jgi:hypothetical protein